jgi:hypothetical protein
MRNKSWAEKWGRLTSTTQTIPVTATAVLAVLIFTSLNLITCVGRFRCASIRMICLGHDGQLTDRPGVLLTLVEINSGLFEQD